MTLSHRTIFNEAPNPHIAFAFGRMNPPHFGHEGLINTLASVAKKGSWALFLSKSQDAKKNPLTYDQKVKWVKALYPQTQGHLVEDPSIKTFLQAAAYLYDKGFRSATFVAGEDDMASMRPVLEQYNGKQVAHGFYHFEPLSFMESPRLTSATNAREAAKSGDPEAFERATRVPPNIMVDGKTLMQAVRIGMGLGESVEESIITESVLNESLSVEQLAHISDKALDDAYHYGLSTPGNNFGWLANIESATAAKRMIDSGITDVEAIANAIHDGWNKTAVADYMGKLQLDTPTIPDKKKKRYALAQQTYAQLPEVEKEKDRVVARAMLKAMGIVTEAPGIGGDWGDNPKLVKRGRKPYEPNVDDTDYGSTHGTDLDLYGLPKYELDEDLTPDQWNELRITDPKAYMGNKDYANRRWWTMQFKKARAAAREKGAQRFEFPPGSKNSYMVAPDLANENLDEAAEKSTKAEAKYQAMPRNGQRCDHCTMWRPPHGCSSVSGKIAANGWCSYYKRSHRKDLDETIEPNSNMLAIAQRLEDYANEHIPHEDDGFGDFMYHAELIRKGHLDIHREDMVKVQPRYLPIMKSITKNELVSESQLGEAASPVLFHYTGSVGAALNILKNNEFMLSISTGSVEDQYAPKGYNYFLSTTRSKVGGYHEFTGGTAVMFNLDGNWFNRRYPVKAIDYWAGFDKQKHSESEDRVFSREPTIPADAITAVHILLKEAGEFASPTTRQLMIVAKKRGLPTYLYSDENAWKLQDTKRAIPVSKAQDLIRGQKKTGYISTFNGKKYLEPWLELIFKKSRSELSKEANKLRYSLTYWNGGQFADDLGLRNEITNARKPGNSGYEAATKIIAAMRKIGASDVKGLLTFLHKKWDAEAQQSESIEEALDPNETHGWILPNRKVEYVTKEEHLGWLYSKDIDGYEEAFKLGYVRFAKATLTFFVQGFLPDLKKMYRVYAQTALGFKHIAVDIIVDERGRIDNQISLDYEMPKDKAKFIKKFGPQQNEHAGSIIGTVGGGNDYPDRQVATFPWDREVEPDENGAKVQYLNKQRKP